MCNFCVTVHNDDLTLIYMVTYSYPYELYTDDNRSFEFFISKSDASKWGDKKTQQAHEAGKKFYFEIEERILN